MKADTAENKKSVVLLGEELVARVRLASVTRNTLLRIQSKAIDHGADITTRGQQLFTQRVIDAEMEYTEVWDEIYALLEADGWSEETCSTPELQLQRGSVAYSRLPAPEAAE